MFPVVGMFDLIGETLRRLRREKGMTLEALGRAARLGRGQLSRIENSHQQVTLASLGKVLASLGVSRQEFFRRYDMVESEIRAVKRQAGQEAGQGDWPEEVRELVSRVESFVQVTLGQPRPVAQGAIETGDLVVLFRVLPKNAPPAEPVEPQPQEAKPKPRIGRPPSKARKRKR